MDDTRQDKDKSKTWQINRNTTKRKAQKYRAKEAYAIIDTITMIDPEEISEYILQTPALEKTSNSRPGEKGVRKNNE